MQTFKILQFLNQMFYVFMFVLVVAVVVVLFCFVTLKETF